MFAEFNFQQMISAFIVLFAVIDIIGSIPIIINLKEKGKDVNALKATIISFLLMIGFFYIETVPCRYRIVCRGWCICYFPVVTGNDPRYRDIQKQRTDKGSNACPSCFSFTGRRRIFYHPAFIKGGICQCQHCSRSDTEYAVGLLCRSYDETGGTPAGQRRYLYYPQVLRYYFAGYLRQAIYCQFDSSSGSSSQPVKESDNFQPIQYSFCFYISNDLLILLALLPD